MLLFRGVVAELRSARHDAYSPFRGPRDRITAAVIQGSEGTSKGLPVSKSDKFPRCQCLTNLVNSVLSWIPSCGIYFALISSKEPDSSGSQSHISLQCKWSRNFAKSANDNV